MEDAVIAWFDHQRASLERCNHSYAAATYQPPIHFPLLHSCRAEAMQCTLITPLASCLRDFTQYHSSLVPTAHTWFVLIASHNIPLESIFSPHRPLGICLHEAIPKPSQWRRPASSPAIRSIAARRQEVRFQCSTLSIPSNGPHAWYREDVAKQSVRPLIQCHVQQGRSHGAHQLQARENEYGHRVFGFFVIRSECDGE